MTAARQACRNCADPLEDAGEPVEVDGEIQQWCEDCARDERERTAELERERLLGVYQGGEMTDAHYEVFQSEKDGLWYWHLQGANGEIQDRSSEGYATKEHANEGVKSAMDASAQAREAAGERDEGGPPAAEVPADE